jgi:hypothetical protein
MFSEPVLGTVCSLVQQEIETGTELTYNIYVHIKLAVVVQGNEKN